MRNYDPLLSFGEASAASYDDHPRGDEAETVAFLAEIARGGPALELAIGTGRIALPLSGRGIRVDGIELSPAMVAQMRRKPGGDRLAVTVGNMADVPVDGNYRLIYLIFNTLFNLLTQDDQVRCFENVAKHLTDDGVFVVEAGLPSEFMGLPGDQYVRAEGVEVNEVRLDVARYDPVTRTLDENHVVLTPEGVRLFPVVTRYAWPSELDLMARIAGLRLQHRWAGWLWEPFTASSRRHISVYSR
ncbi:MAG TPA: class I SAM-dependent methyltransferase [Planctomycetota bacterium]|nr:class I SAM-dependent methyltransferase [Phycisphaerae bacterium]HUW56901.1 class I SAM-dependent methyltransferase [Planctomycetota bacterium]